jgi:hypothetical protein
MDLLPLPTAPRCITGKAALEPRPQHWDDERQPRRRQKGMKKSWRGDKA